MVEKHKTIEIIHRYEMDDLELLKYNEEKKKELLNETSQSEAIERKVKKVHRKPNKATMASL